MQAEWHADVCLPKVPATNQSGERSVPVLRGGAKSADRRRSSRKTSEERERDENCDPICDRDCGNLGDHLVRDANADGEFAAGCRTSRAGIHPFGAEGAGNVREWRGNVSAVARIAGRTSARGGSTRDDRRILAALHAWADGRKRKCSCLRARGAAEELQLPEFLYGSNWGDPRDAGESRGNGAGPTRAVRKSPEGNSTGE
jgi:hypothetical protein